MKIPIVPVLAGMVCGGLLSTISLFIAGHVINKEFTDSNNSKHEETISRIRDLLSGSNDECLTDKYISVINKARDIFENDYNIIMNRINSIIDSNDTKEKILNNLESVIVSIDTINGLNVDNPDDGTIKEIFEDGFKFSEND